MPCVERGASNEGRARQTRPCSQETSRRCAWPGTRSCWQQLLREGQGCTGRQAQGARRKGAQVEAGVAAGLGGTFAEAP